MTMLSKSATRTLLKSLSYRGLSLLTTATIGYFLTGSLETALSFGLVDAAFKLGLYAAHERAWEKVAPATEEGPTEEAPPVVVTPPPFETA